MSELGNLQKRLGYRFKDLSHLVLALTHRSYGHEHSTADNERLEFLGDAVLQMCTTLQLVTAFPTAQEGQLSRMRSELVKTKTLARIAQDLELGGVLRLGKGEDDTGGRVRQRNLANATEAVLGAVYKDGGLEACQALVGRWMTGRLEALKSAPSEHRGWKDPKSRLQELTQRGGGPTPTYELVSEEGPSHEPMFVIRVCVGPDEIGRGEGFSKRAAQSAAARAALTALEERP